MPAVTNVASYYKTQDTDHLLVGRVSVGVILASSLGDEPLLNARQIRRKCRPRLHLTARKTNSTLTSFNDASNQLIYDRLID